MNTIILSGKLSTEIKHVTKTDEYDFYAFQLAVKLGDDTYFIACTKSSFTEAQLELFAKGDTVGIVGYLRGLNVSSDEETTYVKIAINVTQLELHHKPLEGKGKTTPAKINKKTKVVI